jgi:hypothetical protein
MEKYIYDENNGLCYELNGDYYLPCFTLPEVEKRNRCMGYEARRISQIAPKMHLQPIKF